MTEDPSRQQAVDAFDALRTTTAQTNRVVEAVERSRETLTELASKALDQIAETRQHAQQLSADTATVAANSGAISREVDQLSARLQSMQTWASSFDVKIDSTTREALRGEIDTLVAEVAKHTSRLEQSAQEMTTKVANLEDDLAARGSTQWSSSSRYLIAIAFILGVVVGTTGTTVIGILLGLALLAVFVWGVLAHRPNAY